MIYLDYSATTPVDSNVLDTYVKVCKDFVGNPNSLHQLGVDARRLIDASTDQICSVLGLSNHDIIYTSGASEANNLAIKGICSMYQNRGKHIITTELEHSSVIGPLHYLQKLGFDVDFVALDDNGCVDLEDLKRLLSNDTILVSIASVNSEVGIMQPIDKISKLVRQYPKCFFHSDVTQSIGKHNLDFSWIDLASFSAQKFFGMKGIGCLIKEKKIKLEPLIHGGKSTTIFRSGTPATPLIASLAKALRLAYQDLDQRMQYVLQLRDYLIAGLNDCDVWINSNSCSLPYIVNISLKGIKAETMLHALEQEDIYISTQTACSTGNYSKAVFAVTGDKERAMNSLRISLSYLTTREEIDHFLSAFIEKKSQLSGISTDHSK